MVILKNYDNRLKCSARILMAKQGDAMPTAINELSESASTSSIRITGLMRQRIEQYMSARSDPSLYQSVRNMSQFVSDDYGNRFLIELIQNAHDAHDPSRSDGEIAIVLSPDEGDHGCL